jgi:hypothetical protein
MNVACIVLEVEYKAWRLNCGRVFKHTVTLPCSNAEECAQNVGTNANALTLGEDCFRRPVCEICNQRISNRTINLDACDTVAGR